jgi:hypothetical protein
MIEKLGASASQTGLSQAEPEVSARADPFWPHIRVTSYAPSHRQFRLSADLTPEQITAALGIEPKRPNNDKVSLQWEFYAELMYRLPDGGTASTSTGCKIWDYCDARWSAYGWPEVFEQLGLTPLMTQDYGTWAYEEDGNPTLAFLKLGLCAASGTDARRAETPKSGSVHDGPVPPQAADAQTPPNEHTKGDH